MHVDSWLACSDPVSMFWHLMYELDPVNPPVIGNWKLRKKPLVSERKLRLIMCACIRQLWDMLPSDMTWKIITNVEKLSDKQEMLYDEWAPLHIQALQLPVLHTTQHTEPQTIILLQEARRAVSRAAVQCTNTVLIDAMLNLLHELIDTELPFTKSNADRAAVLNDIVGNPWQAPIVCGSWLTPTVKSLAWAAYDNTGSFCPQCHSVGWFVQGHAMRSTHQVTCHHCKGAGSLPNGLMDPVRLVVLSDALEEVGCEDSRILEHLRAPDFSHYRGCHVIDWLIGKE